MSPPSSRALKTLRDEHLLFEVDGLLTGRHQLRSTALSAATHEFAPPFLSETVGRLVGWLEVAQVRPFVTAALIESSHLEEVALGSLIERNLQSKDPALLAESLEALRLVDFQRTALRWNETLEAERVPVAYRAITVQLAMTGNTEADFLRPEIASALPRLDGATGAAGVLRLAFITALGGEWIRQVLVSSGSLSEAADLFSALQDTPDVVTSGLFLSETPLGESLRTCSAEELAEALTAARLVSSDFALALRAYADQVGSIAERISESNPWITEMEVGEEGGQSVVSCRMVVVSDEVITDYHQDAVAIARLVLGCFPEADRADVKLLWPDGQPAALGDHELGVSGLLRQYAKSEREIRWNRTRASVASSAWRIGGADRVKTADEVLAGLVTYLDLLARRYVLGRLRATEVAKSTAIATEIRAKADSMSNYVTADPSVIDFGSELGRADDQMHTLANGITGNLTAGLGRDERNPAQMAAFINDTLLPATRGVANGERWDLIDVDPTERLAVVTSTLQDLLIVLRAVNFGAVSLLHIHEAAASGPYESALARATSMAQASLDSAETVFVESLRQVVGGRSRGAKLTFRSDSEVGALTWPTSRICIGVPCVSVLEVTDRLTEVGAALSGLEWRNAVHPPVLLVPTFAGRPLTGFVQQWTSRILPAEDEFDGWRDSFPPAVDAILFTAVKSCLEALRSISAAIGVSAARSQSDEIQQFADQQSAVVRDSLATIDALGRDPVIDELLAVVESLVRGVEGEALRDPEGEDAAIETLAGAVAAGIRGIGGELWTSYVACLVISAEWDVDPALALRQLNSDGEAEAASGGSPIEADAGGH